MLTVAVVLAAVAAVTLLVMAPPADAPSRAPRASPAPPARRSAMPTRAAAAPPAVACACGRPPAAPSISPRDARQLAGAAAERCAHHPGQDRSPGRDTDSDADSDARDEGGDLDQRFHVRPPPVTRATGVPDL